MKRRYLNESHRRHSEVLRKAVEEMAKHPMTREEKKAQCDRNKAKLEEFEGLKLKQRCCRITPEMDNQIINDKNAKVSQ